MVNGIRASNLHGLNKGCGLKFHVGSQVWQTPDEGWRIHQPQHCEYNKDEDNRPKTKNDKDIIRCYLLPKSTVLKLDPKIKLH